MDVNHFLLLSFTIKVLTFKLNCINIEIIFKYESVEILIHFIMCILGCGCSDQREAAGILRATKPSDCTSVNQTLDWNEPQSLNQ